LLQTFQIPKLSFSHNIHDSLLVILADLIGIIGGYIDLTSGDASFTFTLVKF
jgi:hypothetical protein